MGVSHVYPNRDVFMQGGAHAPGAPLVPPPMYYSYKKADKIQMKHKYDQNVHNHTFGQQVVDCMKIFSIIVYSAAKGTFSTPKND